MNRVSAALEFAPTHPALRGHFPGQPIVPAVALLDEVLMRLESTPDALLEGAPKLGWSIGNAKFHRPARPGEPLVLELDPTGDDSLRFTITCLGELVAQGLLRRALTGKMRG